MQEKQLRCLGQENPLEKEMATHPSIFAWEIPWIEEPGSLRFMGSQRVKHDLATKKKKKNTMCYYSCKRGHGASLVAPMVKNLPAMQETWVRSLGQGDPLEKEMTTHSSIFAWEIPWIEEPEGL